MYKLAPHLHTKLLELTKLSKNWYFFFWQVAKIDLFFKEEKKIDAFF